ncbi:hypothetical protein B4100_3195 [Heyndrickxia coagulans]|nr:hypothetical protein B4100_3195 [Heyndrickxia coagulans]
MSNLYKTETGMPRFFCIKKGQRMRRHPKHLGSLGVWI